LPASGFGWQWVFVIYTFLGILISQYIERRFQPRIGSLLSTFYFYVSVFPNAWDLCLKHGAIPLDGRSGEPLPFAISCHDPDPAKEWGSSSHGSLIPQQTSSI